MKDEMKVIDLLIKKANNEEVPKKIRIYGWCYTFEWVEFKNDYYDEDENVDLMSALSMDNDDLNREVQIIEKSNKIERLKIKDGKLIGKWENGSDYSYTLSAPQTVIVKKLLN